MILSQLKHATSDLHRKAEMLNFKKQIVDKTLTVHQYTALLERNFYFHSLVEKLSEQLLTPKSMDCLGFQSRIKTSYLMRDLDSLKVDYSNSPDLKKYEQQLFHPAKIWGALYVAEGSTLGGRFILQYLKSNNNINQVIKEFHFYQVYASKEDLMWKKFCNCLESMTSEKQATSILEGAKIAFNLFVKISQDIHPQVSRIPIEIK
ncbi:MAG: heme oxygenase [Cyclobacteriaceae bacterium]|nr:MAG: heme oxygenase [Cyclobacteriaceae bacterium]